MKIGDALRAIVKSRGFTQSALAERLHIKQPSVAIVLSNKNTPGLDTLNNYLEVLGYRVALVPVGTNLPEGCYLIDAGEE